MIPFNRVALVKKEKVLCLLMKLQREIRSVVPLLGCGVVKKDTTDGFNK